MFSNQGHPRDTSIAISLLGSVLLVVMLLIPHNAHAGTTVIAWSYYRYPPFVIGKKDGISRDFVALLNEAAHGTFDFELNLLPRKRLDLLLASETPGVVLFVNPSWMGLSDDDPVEWTGALFNDSNAVISNVSRKVNYAGPESVYGMKMGGVFGRKYKNLDEPIAKNLIKRENTRTETLSIRKLSERRVDFVTAPESILRYLVSHLGVENRIYFSPTPLFEYTRHLLLSNPSQQLSEFLMQFVEDLPNNPQWHAIKTKYQLH